MLILVWNSFLACYNFISISYEKRYQFVIFLPVESPRDASNKDSPASQADSGVFSIASSSSPSKGDAAPTTEGTSPDSPNRDRITYTDQAFNRDMNCKYYNILMSQLIWFSFNRLKLKHFAWHYSFV